MGFDYVFTGQRIFRLVLDSMCRPGKISQLPETCLNPPPGMPPYMAAVSFTLLDEEVTFAALGEDGAEWSRYLALNTRAVPAEAERAGFIIAPGSRNNTEMARATRGGLLYPDRGATVLLVVESLAAGGPAQLDLILSGPGVRDTAGLSVAGMDPANLELLAVANSEYPLGLDTVLIGQDGSLACLPRSATFKWKVVA